MNCSVSLKSSSIGNIPTIGTLVSIIEALAKGGALPELNKVLSKGFPLPVPKGLTFISPEIYYFDGFVLVATDIEYQFPSELASDSSVFKMKKIPRTKKGIYTKI